MFPEELGQIGEVLLGNVVEASREVVCIHNTNFPSSIPNIHTPVDGNRHLTSLFGHPSPDALPIGFKDIVEVLEIHGINTSVSNASMLLFPFCCPFSRRCSASNNPKPSTNSS